MSARILTATPLCDGHDASIALVTRMLREAGLEVIYLGFNRSVEAIVKSALEEDVAAVALSSYNGGHMSFFSAVRQALDSAGGSHILLYGGGGGTITAAEAIQLEKTGFKKIFRPGGNIQTDVASIAEDLGPAGAATPPDSTAALVNGQLRSLEIGRGVHCRIQGVAFPHQPAAKPAHTVMLTGRGGSGKSTLLDELLRILLLIPDLKIGVLSIDPTFGDRLRMTVTDHPRVFVHSAPAGETGWPERLGETVDFLRTCGFDLVLIESSGTGQVVKVPVGVDLHIHMMTPDYGTKIQLEKESLLKSAQVVLLNKSDYAGADSRFKELKGFLKAKTCLATSAAQHNHTGTIELAQLLVTRFGLDGSHLPKPHAGSDTLLVPAARRNYLADICLVIDKYHSTTEGEVKRSRTDPAYGREVMSRWQQMQSTRVYAGDPEAAQGQVGVRLTENELLVEVGEKCVPVERKTFTGLWLPVIALPDCDEPGAMVRFLRTENVPGEFPFTGGVFHYRNREEDPIRMFAGLGTAADTNRRFHFLSHGARSVRLSTAFDSLTLYGLDSDHHGAECKVGEGGVAISTIDDMLQLYEGFDLGQCSVSMTINGPAPTLLAMYVVAAQRRGFPLNKLRGTVQADILKEVQAQNEALFPIGAHMRMIADMMEFTNQDMPLWYPISISGYHIGEAGANPVEELAFTLANGFTYVEYMAGRGLDINKFAPRLSFFFTSGSDVEFNVMGRVARRVWAIAMKERYQADPRSQKLKYHTQTSGRTLVERDALANLCRVTLQAHRALFNNTNSLHTNSYKEAYSTPAEDDAHLAIGCQEIPLHEFGDFKFNENLVQGGYGLNVLTQRVEQAVLGIFREIDREGGVDKAIEHQYHRLRIQGSSKQYEEEVASKKRSIFGVNFRVNPYAVPPESGLVRTPQSRQVEQVERVRAFKAKHAVAAETALARLKKVAENDKENLFRELLKTVEVATVGQITEALTDVWGPFRRSM